MQSNEVLKEHYLKSDKVMLGINFMLVVYAFALAGLNDTWVEALIIGAGTAMALLMIYRLVPGSVISRVAMAAGFMVQAALQIHQAHGMIEMHFGIFVLLGVLLYYRDWLPLVVAALVIAVHHLLFFYMQANGGDIWVFESTENGWGIVFLHAGYVVVEAAVFIWLSIDLRNDAMQASEIMSLTNKMVSDDYIDLRQRSSGSTELLERFDGFTSDIENMASQVADTAVQLKGEGEILAKITDEMEQNTDKQRLETDMIAKAVEEMSRAIEDVSKNTEVAAASASQVDESASKATSVSEKTKSSIEQLAIQVSQATETIRELNGETKNIGSVLNVIRGIAEQTNLLALNAAIEAARAGEQGRGFAVVADEVRTLAQRTQEATQEIDKMIESLQSSSESAVVIIEKSLSNVDECVLNTKDSLGLMEGVGRSISEINQLSAVISTAACEQANMMEEISKNLSNIVLVSNETAKDSAKAAGSGAAVLDVSTTLTVLTQRFKVTG
jgi:methyl-accepting chemotaxis protein